MSKKDYIQLASALRKAKFDAISVSEDLEQGVDIATKRIMQVLAFDNPRFNHETFEKAVNKI